MYTHTYFQTFAPQCDQCHSHINPEHLVYDNQFYTSLEKAVFPTLCILWLPEALCACLKSFGFLPFSLACPFLLPLFRSHLDCLVREFYGCSFIIKQITYEENRTNNFLFKYMRPPIYTISLHNYWLWISVPNSTCCQRLPL